MKNSLQIFCLLKFRCVCPAAKDFITVSGINLKQVKLLDNVGRIVAVKEAANSNSISIPVSHITKGIYMVQANFKDGSVKTEKVVVE